MMSRRWEDPPLCPNDFEAANENYLRTLEERLRVELDRADRLERMARSLARQSGRRRRALVQVRNLLRARPKGWKKAAECILTAAIEKESRP
jgi:hypothetical protein